MTTTPDEPVPADPSREPEPENPEVKQGDVTEDPTPPDEDGSTPHTAQDAEGDPPLDADEGDPSSDDYPAQGHTSE